MSSIEPNYCMNKRPCSTRHTKDLFSDEDGRRTACISSQAQHLQKWHVPKESTKCHMCNGKLCGGILFFPLIPCILRQRELQRPQVGCAMGCVFCATGQMGFKRHLTSGEIFEQAESFFETPHGFVAVNKKTIIE